MSRTYGRKWFNQTITPEQDRYQCNVCGFLGVGVEDTPDYNTDATLIPSHSAGHLRVNYFSRPGRCASCGTNDWLMGRRGDL